jgi:GTP cyclohydrolase II
LQERDELEEKQKASANADKAYQNQKKICTAALNMFKKIMKENSRSKGSFYLLREDCFRKVGMKHKAYFAGKLNGKSCANGESSRLFKISQ